MIIGLQMCQVIKYNMVSQSGAVYHYWYTALIRKYNIAKDKM